jgi:exopolysaccharide biosynthesis polyprenyl glycosylphosphotransferase
MRAELDRLTGTGGGSHPDEVRVEQVTVGQTRSGRVTVERVTVEHITTEYVTAEYVTVEPEGPGRAEHRPTDRGRTEQLAGHSPIEPRRPEPRLAEPRRPEPQLAEPRLAEPRLTEPQLAEPQLAEPQLAEPRLTEPRPAEYRAADRWPAEQRTTEARIVEPRVIEHPDGPPPGYIAANHPPANHGHHEPTVTEPSSPWPIRQEPGPARQEPGPARQEPGPARQEPGPAQHESVPAQHEPGPARHEPRSVGHEPRSVGHEPDPVRQEPRTPWHEPGSAWHEPGTPWHEPGSAWPEPGSAQNDRGSAWHGQAVDVDGPRSGRVDADQDSDRSWPIRQDTGRDTGRQDTGRQDTGRQDTGRQDTGRQDTGRQDTGREAGRQDDVRDEALRHEQLRRDGLRRDVAGPGADDRKPPKGHKGSRRSGARSPNKGPIIPSPATSAPGSPAPAGASDYAPGGPGTGAGAGTADADRTDSTGGLSGPLAGNAPPDYVAPDNAPPLSGAGGRIPTDRARNRAVDRHWSPARNRSGAVRPPSRPFIRIPGRHAAMSRRQAWETRYVRALLWCDLLAGIAAGTVAFALRFGDEVTTYNRGYLVLSGLLPVLLLLVLAFSRAYERRFLFVGTDEYQRVIRAGVGLIAGAAVISYALELDLARSYVLAALPTATVAALVLRFALRKRLHMTRKRGENMRRVIVVGHELAVVGITRQLNRERYHGLEVVGACLPPHHDGDVGLPVYGTFDDVGDAVEAATADTVLVLSCPELDGVVLRRLAWRLERDEVDLIVASALIDVAGARTTIRPVDGLPMLHVEHPRLHGGARLVKDTIDRVGALVLTLLLSPVLLGVALSVRLTSRGPVLFRQVRVGRDGTEFRIFKFRSMYVDAEARLAELRHLNEHDGVLFKIRDDPRVTPVGRWLRRLSLDELPQLLNVLTGQMSLVGPRPPLPVEVAAYADDVRRRLAVKPGMTGLWQVSGRSDLSWEEAVRLDLRYVENWSLSLDLVILLRTMTAVVRSSGAY